MSNVIHLKPPVKFFGGHVESMTPADILILTGQTHIADRTGCYTITEYPIGEKDYE